jgi:hypothetical protein
MVKNFAEEMIGREVGKNWTVVLQITCYIKRPEDAMGTRQPLVGTQDSRRVT